MGQQVKPSWEMQDLQPVCRNSRWQGGSAVPLTAGVLHALPGFTSLPIGSGFPGFLLLKFVLAKLNTGFENGCWQIVATSLMKM